MKDGKLGFINSLTNALHPFRLIETFFGFATSNSMYLQDKRDYLYSSMGPLC